MSDLSSFFGQQERRKGEDFVRKDLVVISSASDTNVSAFIKGSSACRVSLTADQVAAPTLSTNCTCPQARKGELCKHVWAVLLKLEEKGADFLEGKSEVLAPGQQSSPADNAREAKAEEYKILQRQKIKDRNKEKREQKKRTDRTAPASHPAHVQESLNYFSANGFRLEELDIPNLQNARKILARVFHPDKGGTHEEVLELNEHFHRVEDYLKS